MAVGYLELGVAGLNFFHRSVEASEKRWSGDGYVVRRQEKPQMRDELG